jgi:hypothetical protein
MGAGRTNVYVLTNLLDILAMSMTYLGLLSRSFMAGTRLCPPANILASSPCLAINSTASATLFAFL